MMNLLNGWRNQAILFGRYDDRRLFETTRIANRISSDVIAEGCMARDKLDTKASRLFLRYVTACLDYQWATAEMWNLTVRVAELESDMPYTGDTEVSVKVRLVGLGKPSEVETGFTILFSLMLGLPLAYSVLEPIGIPLAFALVVGVGFSSSLGWPGTRVAVKGCRFRNSRALALRPSVEWFRWMPLLVFLAFAGVEIGVAYAAVVYERLPSIVALLWSLVTVALTALYFWHLFVREEIYHEESRELVRRIGRQKRSGPCAPVSDLYNEVRQRIAKLERHRRRLRKANGELWAVRRFRRLSHARSNAVIARIVKCYGADDRDADSGLFERLSAVRDRGIREEYLD